MLEAKEKKSDEVKYIKVYKRAKINLVSLEYFQKEYEKMKELKINNVVLYEKMIINDIVNKIMKILKELHKNGVIYNNIKPSNIFVDSENEIYLADNLMFLLNKNSNENEKISYLCPEILKNEDIHMNSDLWNMGILLYELLTKTSPFEKETKEETIKSIIECKYKQAENNESYNEIISKLLKLNKHERIMYDFKSKIANDCMSNRYS